MKCDDELSFVTTVRLDSELKRDLAAMAKKQDRKLANLLRHYARQGLRRDAAKLGEVLE